MLWGLRFYRNLLSYSYAQGIAFLSRFAGVLYAFLSQFAVVPCTLGIAFLSQSAVVLYVLEIAFLSRFAVVLYAFL